GIFKLLDGILPINEFSPKGKHEQPPPQGGSIKTTIKLDQKLPQGILTDDTFGGQQWVTFEYHNLPSQFCEYCRLMGHAIPHCNQRKNQAQERINRNLIQGHQCPSTIHQEEDMELNVHQTREIFSYYESMM
ncbi:hypothetical protein FRX31_027021, partial [Thalictrum thalictroides]